MTTTVDVRTSQVLDEGDAPGSGSRLLLPGTALFFFTVNVLVNWGAITDSAVEGGDNAADSLRTLNFWSQTDGIYSRWEFHHPGPLLFWLEGLAEQLLSNSVVGLNPLGSHILLAIGLATASTSTLVAALDHPGNRRHLAPLAFLFAAICAFDSTAVMPWVPTLGNWFFVLATAGLTAVARDKSWGYPVTVFAALGLVHLHVLFVPLGVLALVVLLGFGVSRRPPLRAVWPSGVVAALLCAPLVVALARGTSPWSRYVALLSSGDDRVREAINEPVAAVVATVAPGLLCLALATGALLTHPRQRLPRLPVLITVTGIAYLVVMSVLNFLTRYSFGTTILLVGATAVISSVHLKAPKEAPAIAAFALGLVVVIDVFVAPNEVHMRAPQAEAAGRQFADFLRSHPGAQLRIDNAPKPYFAYWDAPGLALLAERNGFDYCVVADRWPHWTQPDQLCGATRPAGPLFTVVFGPHSYVTRVTPPS